jgi:N utilization substance protein B
MRLSTFEMRFAENRLPPGVAINEAVEISRKYGTLDSGSFVNGILDQVAKG